MAINIRIDEVLVPAYENDTILDAAYRAGIDIPVLCFLKGCAEVSACRMCVVEVEGNKRPVAACSTLVKEGMSIRTNTPELFKARRTALELMCSNHRMDCEFCVRYSDCEFHALLRDYGVDEREYSKKYVAPCCDKSAAPLLIDMSKCVRCRRCVSACAAIGANVLQVLGRGSGTYIGTGVSLSDSDCIYCGQCAAVCPTGAIEEASDGHKVWHALEEHRNKYLIAMVSPEVCRTLGRHFHEEEGFDVSGKIAALLRRYGFSKVVSTEYGNTLAGDALAAEFMNSNGLLLSSDCPAWAEYCRRQEVLASNVSKVKDPITLLAAKCRELYAEETQGKSVYIVAFTGCIAGKHEASENKNGVDASMTANELADFIRKGCVSRFTAMQTWRSIEGESFDELEGMERSRDLLERCSALLPETVKAVEVTGTVLAPEELKNYSDCGILRVRVCPGGCANGGGLPRLHAKTRNTAKDKPTANKKEE